MEAKKGEGEGRRQKVVIGIFVAAVVIAALFTVTMGIGMNNSDTGNGVVEMGSLGDTITAYGNGGEATSSNDVRINGILSNFAQDGDINFAKYKGTVGVGGNIQTIYAGTSGFLITIDCTAGDFDVKYYVDGDRKTSTKLYKDQSTTLSYGYGKGELKRIDVIDHGGTGVGNYDIS